MKEKHLEAFTLIIILLLLGISMIIGLLYSKKSEFKKKNISLLDENKRLNNQITQNQSEIKQLKNNWGKPFDKF